MGQVAEAVREGQAAEKVNLAAVSVDELLAEIGRRGHGKELSGSIGALHDHLERTGALDSDSNMTAYLVYRLRRDEYLSAPGLSPEQRREAANVWQEKIDAL